MRTVTFKSVYESILRRIGYNPRGDAVKEDVANNVLEHINNRVRFVWGAWDWPELNVVEWRAFRRNWLLNLSFALGDELYYLGDNVVLTVPPDHSVDFTPGTNAGYYECIHTSTPIGTLPTNATYFSPIDDIDRYISYQQAEDPVFDENLPEIGDVLDVYPHSPRGRRFTRIMHFQPSSKGIDVLHSKEDYVWLRYRIPPSQFTLEPQGVASANSDTEYYDPVTGNCFQQSKEDLKTDQRTYSVVPFPFFLAGYVRAAAYADAILETTMEAQMRMTLSSAAMNEAQEYLMREIDNLAVQGQRFYYNAFPSRHRFRRQRPGVASGAVPNETFGGYG